MQYIYHCKHCRTVIDVFETNQEHADIQLGLSALTAEEQDELLSYDEQGQKVYIRTICDYCFDAIKSNPELALIGNPLQ